MHTELLWNGEEKHGEPNSHHRQKQRDRTVSPTIQLRQKLKGAELSFSSGRLLTKYPYAHNYVSWFRRQLKQCKHAHKDTHTIIKNSLLQHAVCGATIVPDLEIPASAKCCV